jgi:hypothetical protein
MNRFVTFWLLTMVAASAAHGHGTPTHQTLMDYASAKAGELPAPLSFTGAQATRMREGAYDEDNGTRSLDHAWNPLTGDMFPLATMTARDAAADRWNSMVNAFLAGNFDGGDGSGAWHYLGRASHLIQDMTSPLHSFAMQHAAPSCQFENYWQANDASLRAVLTGIGGPLHSSALDPKCTEKLDGFSAQRLQFRFDNNCPDKNNDDIRGWSEVLAWTAYFRATFWSEIKFVNDGSSGPATTANTTGTTFSDGFVGPQANALHSMFNGNVRWIASFFDDYYEITDRNGAIFRWMSWTDIDDWQSCGRTDLAAGGWAPGYQDSSILAVGGDSDDHGARTTGRFWFDLRELGRDTSGSFNRYCYPQKYPNGDAMTGHLHQYFGEYLDPLTVRYNAGLLGLANRRVTVRTAGAESADAFSWSRRDNFASGPGFAAGPGGSDFHFVAKSGVTLTAPATNQAGRAFLRWLKDGAVFAGNTNRTLAINTAAAPIPATGVVYTADFHADSDGDGMPDWWEEEHFDHGAADAGFDSDSDGLSNLQEFLAGTVPTNAASVLSILSTACDVEVTLSWASIPGRTYRVLHRDSPDGAWEEDLPDAQITAQAGQSSLSYSDTTADASEGRCYAVMVIP